MFHFASNFENFGGREPEIEIFRGQNGLKTGQFFANFPYFDTKFDPSSISV